MFGVLATVFGVTTMAIGGYNVARYAVGRVKLRKRQIAEAKELYNTVQETHQFAHAAYDRVSKVYETVATQGLDPYKAQLRAAKAALEKALADDSNPGV